MLHSQILTRHHELQTRIDQLKNALTTFPEGRLVCCHHNNHHKWYISDGHTKTYIPKADRGFAEQLAIKQYLVDTLQDLTREEKALKSYLDHYGSYTPKADRLLTDIPAYADLLSTHFKPLSQELQEWAHAPYEHNPKHIEKLIHKTSSGHIVRSKSEAMIASLLYVNHIPFRYEAPLPLNSLIFYPDFTIRHPRTGQFFYWEHFGKMDDAAYCNNTFQKLQTYSSHGIVPSIQLITTYETQDNPLNTDVIQKIIDHYFL